MDTQRIESFKQFAQHLEYPMVVFEAESGKVLEINYEAEVLLGNHVECIRIEPGRAMTKSNFWEMLHGKKSIVWYRIRLIADDKEMLVSGLVNEATVENRIVYTLLFERRADLNIGSLTLERIVNHAGIVALHISVDADVVHVEYMSQNINQFGYTRAQFYEKMIDFKDVICPEDMEQVRRTMKESADRHANEGTMECRLITEERQLIPVRLQVRYIYNDYGKLSDMEILLTDLREERKRNSENQYLSHGIAKSKSVVLVKAYEGDKRTLRYISPNAAMIGMNTEALQKGYRLTEDYIHPDDRDEVIDAVYQAVENGVTDYVQVYRMVRDDGKKIWVENEVTVTRISDGEAEISFLLTDITEQKELETEISIALEKEASGKKPNPIHMITTDGDNKEMLAQFELMAETLSANADYYTVVLDNNGSLLTKPKGPERDLGLFYDFFERPVFKEQFTDLSNRAKQEMIPQSVSFELSNRKVHVVLAPLMMESNVTAYWVMTSFGENGMELLGKVAEQQWKLANVIVRSFYAEEAIKRENHRNMLLETQFHKEQQEVSVIMDIIDSMTREGDAGLGEICQKAGVYLGVQNIGLYTENKDIGKVETYYTWNNAGEDTPFFETMSASQTEYAAIQGRFAENPLIITDCTMNDAFLRNLVRQTQMGAIVLARIPFSIDLTGYLVLADSDVNREFDNKDQHFIKALASAFASVLQASLRGGKPELLQEGFLDAYDHIRDAVLVKSNRSGEIIFANKAMDKLFGYSVIGMNITEIINDRMEQYRNMQGFRKRLIANKKVTKWQSYMKELDQIMNIVEVHLDTINGADISLVILKKNKNKDKKLK